MRTKFVLLAALLATTALAGCDRKIDAVGAERMDATKPAETDGSAGLSAAEWTQSGRTADSFAQADTSADGIVSSGELARWAYKQPRRAGPVTTAPEDHDGPPDVTEAYENALPQRRPVTDAAPDVPVRRPPPAQH